MLPTESDQSDDVMYVLKNLLKVPETILSSSQIEMLNTFAGFVIKDQATLINLFQLPRLRELCPSEAELQQGFINASTVFTNSVKKTPVTYSQVASNASASASLREQNDPDEQARKRVHHNEQIDLIQMDLIKDLIQVVHQLDSLNLGQLVIPSNLELVMPWLYSLFKQVANDLGITILPNPGVILDETLVRGLGFFKKPNAEQFRVVTDSKLQLAITTVIDLFAGLNKINLEKTNLSYADKYIMNELVRAYAQSTKPLVPFNEKLLKYANVSSAGLMNMLLAIYPSNSSGIDWIIPAIKLITKMLVKSDKHKEHMEHLIPLIMADLSTLVESCYIHIPGKKETEDFKRRKARNKSLVPGTKDYVDVIIVRKPLIDPGKGPTSKAEGTAIASLNAELNKISHRLHGLGTNISSPNEKLELAQHISQKQYKLMKKVNDFLENRKSRVHNLVKATHVAKLSSDLSEEQLAEDRKKPFTVDEWKEATEIIVSQHNDCIDTVLREIFDTEDFLAVNWDQFATRLLN